MPIPPTSTFTKFSTTPIHQSLHMSCDIEHDPPILPSSHFRAFQLDTAACWGRQDWPLRPRRLLAVLAMGLGPQTAIRWPHQSLRLESALTPHPGSIGSLEDRKSRSRVIRKESVVLSKGKVEMALAWLQLPSAPTLQPLENRRNSRNSDFSTENLMKKTES